MQTKNSSKTSWTARIESIKAILIDFEGIINVLNEILTNSDGFLITARKLKLGLRKKILQLDFIACLMFGKNIFIKLKALMRLLEKQILNITDGMALIRSTLNILKAIRNKQEDVSIIIAAIRNCAEKSGINSIKHY